VNKTQKKNNPQLKPFAPHRVRQVRPDLFKSETLAKSRTLFSSLSSRFTKTVAAYSITKPRSGSR
jgi:hypothetical protein